MHLLIAGGMEIRTREGGESVIKKKCVCVCWGVIQKGEETVIDNVAKERSQIWK